MGVRGLTSLLQKRGVLPADPNISSVRESEYYCHIPPGSTLCIDGPGLAFYIYEHSYRQHYEHFLHHQQQQEFDCTIRHLLPCMLPLSYIQTFTEQMMDALLNIHKVNVTIYWDGPNKRMKMFTSSSRNSKRDAQSRNLERFCAHGILPKSFNKKGRIPLPQVFLDEFPMPILAISQVRHTLEWMELLLSSKSNKMGTSLQNFYCEEEADRDVALASASDTSNTTYAVGADSDYCIYGVDAFSAAASKNHVLYAPLHYLQWKEEEQEESHHITLSGIVVTRKDIAHALHLSNEQLLLEASILMGNDYTGEFVLKQQKSSCNFFKDFGSGGTDGSKLAYEDILLILARIDEEDDAFIITSEIPEFQYAIDFTRDLYSFRDITFYPLDREEEDDPKNEDENGSTLILDLSTNSLSWRKIQYLVEEMVEDDHSVDTLRQQILSPFENTFNSEDLKQLTFILRFMQQKPQPTLFLPKQFQWKHQAFSHVLQKTIAVVLKARSKHGVCAHPEIAPAIIFQPILFHHVMAALHHGVRTGRIVSDTPSAIFGEDKGNQQAEIDPAQGMLQLPIDEHKDTILESVQQNRVTIIQGETGCGKSSKVPIMLLEAPPPHSSFREVRMFICQPRRIAAKSLTERIKSTHPQYKHLFGLRMGHGVKEETKSTRVWFATTGYLVRLLANKPEYFDNCSHLVIDEVHERSVETDVLCLLARRLLVRNKHIRLILMSATVAADMYRDYFVVEEPPLFVGVRCFPIKEHYMEDIVELLQLSPREEAKIKEISNKIANSRCKMVPNANDRVAIHDLAVQLAAVVSTSGSSVLIFVPGMADIINIMELFENVVCHNKSFTCIPIHSDVPFEDQMSAFDAPEEGKVKIIIATNAAESSVTLPDVDHVICLGLCKQISYNPQSHRQILDCTWISKASATQRAGRTGRVRNGNVYRLYPRVTFEHHMLPFEEGEILRTPLDSVILTLKTIVENDSVTELLMECLEPPSLSNVERSLDSLHECNFISVPSDDFAITPLGSFVVALGVDLALGSFIGYGIRMGVGPEAIDVAAALSSPKSPWLIPNALLQEPDTYNDIVAKTYVSKGRFDAHLYSEPLAISNLLWDFEKCTGSDQTHLFCRRFGIHHARLKYILSTRNSLRMRVANTLGIDSDSLVLKDPPRKACGKNIAIIRAIHVWLFHDCIIRLNSGGNHMQKNGDGSNFEIDLKGDLIEEEHLSQMFKSPQHDFCLNTNCNAVFHASYQLEEIDFTPYVINDDEFERRLISLAMEKDISCVMIVDSETFGLYASPECLDEITHEIKKYLSFEAVFDCSRSDSSNHRGWKGRDCGAWVCKIVDDIDQGGNSQMIKLSCNSGSGSGRQKAFTRIRKFLHKNCTFSSLSINLKKIYELEKSGILTIFAYRSLYVPSETIIADLLGTTPHKVRFTGQREHTRSQSIIFYGNDSESSSTCLINNKNAPEAARILVAASSGYNRSRKAVVRFKDFSQIEGDSEGNINESDMFLETFPQITKTSARWTHAASGGYIYLDSTNFPASVYPTEEMDIFACCGNTLELSGGGYRVESLTLLPPGTSFAGLAMKCIGVDAFYGTILPEFQDRLELVEAFREQLMDTTGDHLEYSPELSKIFGEIFAPFIGGDVVYESDHSVDTINEEKKTCAEEKSERDANAYVSYISGKLGAEYMPTSFLALGSSGGISGDNSIKHFSEGRVKSTTSRRKKRNNLQKALEFPYICPLCDEKNLDNLPKLLRHVVRHHNKVTQSRCAVKKEGKNNTYACLFGCHGRFKWLQCIDHHIESHLEEMSCEHSKCFTCPRCDEELFTLSGLAKHTAESH